MSLILFKLKRVLYWGNADQRMDFTTIDDTAAFTASAALDPSTPRFLRLNRHFAQSDWCRYVTKCGAKKSWRHECHVSISHTIVLVGLLRK
jgi:nucleoside-diphosphate-sugar epimerase